MYTIHDDEWPEAVCVDVVNRFYLMLCDIINYRDVISVADLYKSILIFV